MQGYAAPGYDLWFELVLVLSVGTVVIVGLATLGARFVASAVWRRTIWQAATLGTVALVLVELTGTGPALVRLCRAKIGTPAAETRAAPTAADQQPKEPPPAAAMELVMPRPRAFVEEGEFSPVAGESAEAGFAEADWGGFSAGRLAPFAQRDFVPGEEPISTTQNATRRKTAVLPAESGCAWWPGVIWLLGAVVVAGRIAGAQLLLFVFRRRHAAVGDEALCRRVGGLARRLGIRRPVCVLEAVGLRAPVAFGSFRPTVTLPVAFADDFDWRQQEAVLAHELAHLAAGDPAWQLVADLLSAALWWHPLVWWARRRLRAAGEAAADEASLLVPGGADALAACLVALGRRLARPPRLGWLSVGGAGFRSGLGRRVQRLLSIRARPWRAPGRGRLVCAKTVLPVALVIVAVSCTAWARTQATLRKGETTMNVLTSSWRHSLAAMAFAALLSPASADAVADDSSTGQSAPVVARDDLPDDGLLALQEKDKDAEARRERREVEERERREVVKRLQAHARELMQERQKLEERAHAIKRELEERKDQDGEEAKKLRAQLREIQEVAGRLEREVHEIMQRLGRRPEGPQPPEREQLNRRLEEIKRQIGRLREAGKQDEAERMEREAHEIMRRLKERPEQRRPGPPEDVERRIRHAKVAIENLHAAGLHDLAERLAQEVERRIAERREGGRPRPEGPPRPEHPQGPRPPEHPDRVVHELRGEVQQLRREVDELRRLLKELLERERRSNR